MATRAGTVVGMFDLGSGFVQRDSRSGWRATRRATNSVRPMAWGCGEPRPDRSPELVARSRG
jgi:hypothetical protein